MTGTHFFDLPVEIRIKIYSEVLVQSAPIVIRTTAHKAESPQGPKTVSVNPKLLCVNKWIHSEATPILYSKNYFQIHDEFHESCCADIAPFLYQIGSQTRHIRRMSINFPYFYHFGTTKANLDRDAINVLELIRNTCTSLITLELFSLCGSLLNNKCYNESVPVEAPDVIDTHIRAIPSPKHVAVSIHIWSKEYISDSVVNRMRDYGWTVEIKEIQIVEDEEDTD